MHPVLLGMAAVSLQLTTAQPPLVPPLAVALATPPSSSVTCLPHPVFHSRHMPLPAPAVVHCFTGGREELQRLLDLGLYVGVTGWIADDRPERGGAELAALLPLVPRDRLMIETDAPYLVPRSIKWVQNWFPAAGLQPPWRALWSCDGGVGCHIP